MIWVLNEALNIIKFFWNKMNKEKKLSLVLQILTQGLGGIQDVAVWVSHLHDTCLLHVPFFLLPEEADFLPFHVHCKPIVGEKMAKLVHHFVIKYRRLVYLINGVSSCSVLMGQSLKWRIIDSQSCRELTLSSGFPLEDDILQLNGWSQECMSFASLWGMPKTCKPFKLNC